MLFHLQIIRRKQQNMKKIVRTKHKFAVVTVDYNLNF
jgi:hypothetical protein